MITLEINGKEFNIASSYEELSLGQYIDIIKAGESKQQLEATDSDIKMICLLSDNPSELEPLLWDFSVEEFKELTNEFNWVADTSLLYERKGWEKYQISDTFKYYSTYRPYTIQWVLGYDVGRSSPNHPYLEWP